MLKLTVETKDTTEVLINVLDWEVHQHGVMVEKTNGTKLFYPYVNLISVQVDQEDD